MAKTNAERLREFKARKKEQEKIASLTLDDVFKTPFFETLPEDFHISSDFEDPLAFIGLPVPEFTDDRGLEDFTHYSPETAADMIEPNLGSLGRAEVMITALTEAAAALAFYVNKYKRDEIEARLAEIEASDLSKPEAKKAALQEAARLNKMLDQLERQVRWTFPQWKVTG
ncbi:MAG: hemolysin XhlA [Rhodobacteraceae bacterium HLUCCA12]|nr:MAG: hemolysin XhlA [Rhodobacteraceae bacterium HLUCCA12]